MDLTIWTLITLHAEVFVSVQVLHPYTANDCVGVLSCQLVGTCISILDYAWILLYPFITDNAINLFHTRMWANAQRDGSPAEYRWHPLFNAAKFGWRPLLECCAITLPRCETLWNLQGCTKPANGSQPIVGWSPPYYEDIWRRYWCLTSFFPIVNTCLSCKDTAQQSCPIVRRWQISASFCLCISIEPCAAHFRPAF